MKCLFKYWSSKRNMLSSWIIYFYKMPFSLIFRLTFCNKVCWNFCFGFAHESCTILSKIIIQPTKYNFQYKSKLLYDYRVYTHYIESFNKKWMHICTKNHPCNIIKYGAFLIFLIILIFKALVAIWKIWAYLILLITSEWGNQYKVYLELEGNQNKINCLASNFYNTLKSRALFSHLFGTEKSAGNFILL